MKADYWNVSDEQVMEKTGKPMAHWAKVLTKFGALQKKSTESVAHRPWRASILGAHPYDSILEGESLSPNQLSTSAGCRLF
jgi:hypothetical protein